MTRYKTKSSIMLTLHQAGTLWVSSHTDTDRVIVKAFSRKRKLVLQCSDSTQQKREKNVSPQPIIFSLAVLIGQAVCVWNLHVTFCDLFLNFKRQIVTKFQGVIAGDK